MKVAFVTIYDAQDIKNWSGTPFYMSKAFLDAGVELEFINGLKTLPEMTFMSFVNDFFYNRLFKEKRGKYIPFYESNNLEYIASQVQRKIEGSNADIVFSPGAIPIAYLNTNKPVVMWSDATFAVMHNYYSQYTGFCTTTANDCHKYEKNVMKRLALSFYSSEWAATSAIKYYGANKDSVKVVSYGANIRCNRTNSDIKAINSRKSVEICKLLFVGQDWVRKGGPAAIEIARELNRLKVKAELTIVGCKPPEGIIIPDFVKIVGFVDKSEKAGVDLLEKLYCENHFFVLPTIAECTPIVFSEANSYGLPVITTNTGGIPSVIRDGVNGKMFHENFDPIVCALYIQSMFLDASKYNAFSLTAFNEYLSRLNWRFAIQEVIFQMGRLI